MRHVPLVVIAAGIAAAGVLGVGLPALMNAAEPVDFFRGAAHGRNSPTTLSGPTAHVPEHRWRNELPADQHLDSPLDAEVPESGGRPRGVSPIGEDVR